MMPESIYYVLDDARNPVPATQDEWASMFSDIERRRVATTAVAPGWAVSTVFLGMDHRFVGDGPPILFESMVFGPDGADDAMRRYATWAEAEFGHAALVDQVRAALRSPEKLP